MYDEQIEESKQTTVENEYEDDFDYYAHPSTNTTKIKAIAALVAFFVVVGFFAVQYPKIVEKMGIPKLPASNNISAAAQIDTNDLVAENSQENLGDFFYNEAGGDGTDIANNSGNSNNQPSGANATGESAINFDSSKEDNTIMVSLGTSARKNPFMPSSKVLGQGSTDLEFEKVPFEIIEPPTSYTVDPTVNKLLETKITGIMYDKHSPSAVVMIDGTDEFVKVGDKILGYTITSITSDKVVISYGQNTFAASIGQLFSPSELTKERVVSNLEKKFGGARRNYY